MTDVPRRLRPDANQRRNTILRHTRGASSGQGSTSAARPVRATRTTRRYVSSTSIGIKVGDTSAATDSAVAIRSTVNSVDSTGSDTIAYNFGVAIGAHAQALDEEAVALGPTCTANGPSAVAVGFTAAAYGQNNVSIGAGATCGASGTPVTSSTAIGVGATTTRDHEVVIGTGTEPAVIAGGVVLKDGSGGLWKLVVSTGGVLSTVAYP